MVKHTKSNRTNLAELFSFSVDMRELILFRGLPGSGKSTLAAVLARGVTDAVYSVDDYFTNAEGEYHFEFEQNHLAYKQCEMRSESAMQANESRIFVHNTFVYDWEMEPYFALAAKFDYRVHVITVENRHGGENVHGVSREQIEKMAAKYSVLLF